MRIFWPDYKNRELYSDNQKTMEQKDDMMAILRHFDVLQSKYFTRNLAKHNLSEKGLFTLYNSNV